MAGAPRPPARHDLPSTDVVAELAGAEEPFEVVEPPEGVDPAEEAGIALAADFAAVARDLHGQPTTDLTLHRLVELAVEMVETCEDAGVTVARGGSVTSAAATSSVVEELDAIQGATGEGPVPDGLRRVPVYRTDDLAAEPSWPAYREQAGRLGIRSVLSFRLFSEDAGLGALTLYSRQPAAFDDGHFATGAIFAAHASVALATAREADTARTLRRAVDSNRTIGMAMGILMATLRIDEDAAFGMLRELSSTQNRKLSDVAAEVVSNGVPAGPGD